MKLAISILNQPKVKELVDEARSEYSFHTRTNHQFFIAGGQSFADDVILTQSMPLDINWQTKEPFPIKYGEIYRKISEEASTSVDHLIQAMYGHWGNFLKMSEQLTLGDEYDRVVVITNPSGIIKYSVRDTRGHLEEDFLYVDSFSDPMSFTSTLLDYDNFTCDVCTFGKLVQLWKNISSMSVNEAIWITWLRRQRYLTTLYDDSDFGKFVWRFWCAKLGIKVRRNP